MIDLYTWGTPNGRKVSVMLEEMELPYAVHPVNIMEGDQFKVEFLAISPNNKIPGIVDPDGPGGEPISLFESGAILMYLARKTGSPLLPPESDAAAYWSVMQWLMFQMGNIGPFFGQANHFLRFAKEDVPYGKKRYRDEAHRLYGVMDLRLAGSKFLAGDAYSIADVASYPWCARWEWHEIDLGDIPNVKRWFEEIGARPAVTKGMEVP